jgi:hypothetical protein
MMKFDDVMSGAGVVIEDERRRGLKRMVRHEWLTSLQVLICDEVWKVQLLGHCRLLQARILPLEVPWMV